MGASVVGCAKVGTGKREVKLMSEKVINAKSGKYGRLQVTLLLPVKHNILDMAKRSGVNRAAFLRMALMIGASHLAQQVRLSHSPTPDGAEELAGQTTART
jgi:hypothetical protein